MHPHTITIITLVILVPLLAWRIYSRFRRMIGRQKLSKIRPWITVFILPIAIVLLSYQTHQQYAQICSLIGGLIIGTILGVLGLQKTVFEQTNEGLFYTPNAFIGVSILILLICRVIYRVFEIATSDVTLENSTNSFLLTPLTLICFGLLAGYYICYATGLIKWQYKLRQKATSH
jgi:hypothetical protein